MSGNTFAHGWDKKPPPEDVNIELEHFQISLHSDVYAPDRHLVNSPAKFTVPLHEPLIFPFGQKWEVALLEIFFPTTVKNVEGEMCRVRYQKKITRSGSTPVTITQEFRIPAAAYTPLKLVRTLQSRLYREKIAVPYDTVSDEESKADAARIFRLKSSIKLNTDTNKVIFNKAADESFTFSESLLRMLGLNEEKVPLRSFSFMYDIPRRIVFHFPPMLDREMQMMFVYTDIVKYSQMANSAAPLIRMLHLGGVLKNINKSDGFFIGSHAIEFLHAQYHPVQGNEIKEVNVQLRDSRGNLINFHGGKTVLNLRFVRRK